MKTIPGLVVLTLLAGCSREAPLPPLPESAAAPSVELVDELARDPERLKEVRRLCREDWQAISEELCIASAQATRRRFMGEGATRYTPEPIELPEAEWPEAKDE